MGIMEGIQMPAFAGFRRGLVSGNQGGGAVVGSVVNQAVIVFFDLAAGGRVPGVLYGSGPLMPQGASWWQCGASAPDWTG